MLKLDNTKTGFSLYNEHVKLLFDNIHVNLRIDYYIKKNNEWIQIGKAFENKSKELTPVVVYKKGLEKEKKEVANKFLQFSLNDEEAYTGRYKIDQMKKKMKYIQNTTQFVEDWKGMVEKVSLSPKKIGFLPASFKDKLPQGVKVCKVN